MKRQEGEGGDFQNSRKAQREKEGFLKTPGRHRGIRARNCWLADGSDSWPSRSSQLHRAGLVIRRGPGIFCCSTVMARLMTRVRNMQGAFVVHTERVQNGLTALSVCKGETSAGERHEACACAYGVLRMSLHTEGSRD